MKAFPPLARWAAASILSLASALAAAAVPEDSRRAVLPADAMPSGAASVQLWHAAARDAIARHKPNQQAALRLLAYLSLAQHRAAEALAAGPGPASDAAWSALFDRASVQTLDALLPAQAVGFDALAQGLASAREASLPAEELARVQTLAEQAAREVLERAAHDGYDAPWHGSLPQDAAAWRSLLNPARPPHLPGLGSMKTLFLASGSAVRPPAPPAPGSARFAEALAEVRERAGSGSPQGLARARRWEMTSGSLVAGFWDETAVGRLRRAHGHEVHPGVDGLDEMLQRHRLHVHSALGVREKWKQHGCEVLLGDQHAGAVRERGRDQTRERRHLVADDHAFRRAAHEAGELSAGAVDHRVVSRRLGTARPPGLDGRVEGLDRASGRQPDAGGVDVDPGGGEFLLGDVQAQHIDALLADHHARTTIIRRDRGASRPRSRADGALVPPGLSLIWPA